MKKITLYSIRVLLIIFLIFVQMVFIFFMLNRLSKFYFFNYILIILSYVIVIYLVHKNGNTSIKLAWSILILSIPLVGGVLYLMFGGKRVPKKLRIAGIKKFNDKDKYLSQDIEVLKRIKSNNKLFKYGLKCGDFPIYENTEVTFFKSGEEKLEKMLDELKKAKHFIFIEYFIIEEGIMWQKILDILKSKASEGIEVKIIYDDFGSKFNNFNEELKQYGIEALCFNPIKPTLIIQMNNRDHRKICVIDNNVVFTGGINIGDEYINQISPYGYWKDTAIMLKGEAVRSFTILFLQVYSYLKGDFFYVDYDKYDIPCEYIEYDGLIQPYFDSPTDEEDVGLNMHLNIINNAKDYIYIQTPYLIIDEQMQNALGIAAKSGVDVRITVPHIPDKKYVFEVTQNNYLPLLKNGVKIYEYTPGFMHSKAIVSDNVAICGTINMDFRSYYHHFECGVLIKDSKIIKDMYKDQIECISDSHEITIEECKSVNFIRKVYRAVLTLFAPLL